MNIGEAEQIMSVLVNVPMKKQWLEILHFKVASTAFAVCNHIIRLEMDKIFTIYQNAPV